MFYHWQGDALVIAVQVQTRASKDEFAGPKGDQLRIRITAAPVDGKANAHLIKFLAKQFGVTKSTIVLEKGETSRNKRLRIPAPKSLPPFILKPN
jgi:hypothetical protein